MNSENAAEGEVPTRQHKSRSVQIRQGIRVTIRVLLSLWAVIWAITAVVGTLAADDPLGSTLAGLLIFWGIGFSPLVAHTQWSRRRPIVDAGAAQGFAAPLPAPPPELTSALPSERSYAPGSAMAKLQQIRSAAEQLQSRSWISAPDSDAIDQRIARLTDLALADAHSVQLGGAASAGLSREVAMLHTTVIGLLDASIESSAVEPGDSAIDNRLQHHLDLLHGRSAAIAELEGRVTEVCPPQTNLSPHQGSAGI